MPPVMITKVQAIARTPSTAVACRMPRILSICMNAGEAILKKTSSRMRLAKARSFCRAVGPKSRARKPDGRPSLARASDRMVIVFVSRRFHGFALGRQLHDPLLRRVAGRQLARDPSFAHHDDAIAHPKDFGQFRRDHDDSLALLSERAQELVNFALGADVDAARRLVEKQHVAVALQPFRDDDLLLI